MHYIKLINGTPIRYTLTDLRRANPQVSFATTIPAGTLAEYNIYPLILTEQPVFDSLSQRVEEGAAILIEGNWIQVWNIINLDNNEVAAMLAAMKLSKNNEINSWRISANHTSFTHQGKVIACDALSRGDIDAIAGYISLYGAFPANFPNAWKSIDNTYLMLPDIDSFKNMYASMTAQGLVNFGHAQDLKSQLAAATTTAQINSIVW